jgi:uroporphyrinogen-III synthase
VSGPLAGINVLVTRPPGQASKLSDALARVGAVPIEVPVVQIKPPLSWESVDAAIERGGYDWVVFTSANGVERFWDRICAQRKGTEWFRVTRVAAVGTETARALKDRGIRVDVIPEEFVADALVAVMTDAEPLSGRRVLLPAADIARDTLAVSLAHAEALVERVTVYRTVPAAVPPRVRDLLAGGEIGFVTFTSASTVNGLLDALNGETAALDRTRIACIGPVTAEAARTRGLHVDVVAAVHTIPGLVDAMCDFRIQTVRESAATEATHEA